jgi:hypothetical protein
LNVIEARNKKAYQVDTPLWSNEEHVQKHPGRPPFLGVTEH